MSSEGLFEGKLMSSSKDSAKIASATFAPAARAASNFADAARVHLESVSNSTAETTFLDGPFPPNVFDL